MTTFAFFSRATVLLLVVTATMKNGVMVIAQDPICPDDFVFCDGSGGGSGGGLCTQTGTTLCSNGDCVLDPFSPLFDLIESGVTTEESILESGCEPPINVCGESTFCPNGQTCQQQGDVPICTAPTMAPSRPRVVTCADIDFCDTANDSSEACRREQTIPNEGSGTIATVDAECIQVSDLCATGAANVCNDIHTYIWNARVEEWQEPSATFASTICGITGQVDCDTSGSLRTSTATTNTVIRLGTVTLLLIAAGL